ncbi:MAG: glutathione S-transferase [Deltaproteobacteria bacterium]|nr:glutathione S-transferase [Deltaproteobacteria bacterium]
MKLYHVPGSRSARVLWLLLELGLEHELVRLSLADGSLRAPEYLAIHPLGRVPSLEDEGQTFYESGAIVQYLLERYGEGRFQPPIGSPDRAKYLQWFHWGEATLLPPVVAMNANRFVLREADRSAKAIDVAQRQLARILAVLEREVEGRAYLVGDEFTAADLMVGYGITLAKLIGELPEDFPSVHRWLDGLAARPAYEEALRGGFAG